MNRKIAALIFIVIVILFFQFVYLPKIREVKRLGAEYKKVKSDINELYNFIGGEASLKDNIIKMQREMAALHEAFPFEKDVSNIIRQLNDEAKRFGINVVSVKPGDFTMCRDAQGSEIKLLSHLCKYMPVNLSVEARFQALGEFLEEIERNKKPVISVIKADMKKDANIAPKIKADIEINACVLGE